MGRSYGKCKAVSRGSFITAMKASQYSTEPEEERPSIIIDKIEQK